MMIDEINYIKKSIKIIDSECIMLKKDHERVFYIFVLLLKYYNYFIIIHSKLKKNNYYKLILNKK